MKRVYYVTLFVTVLSVSSNPVAQIQSSQQCPIHQQNPYNNPGSSFQLAANNNPYPQQNNDQNPISSRSDLDGTINQLLMTKIFKNPCVQKILDPTTRLYNQNGQEVQRNLNSGATPSVINNYFIVPPEFFSLNKTDTAVTPKTGKKRRGNSKPKGNQSKPSSQYIISDENDTIIKDQPSTRKNNGGRKKKSKPKHERTAKLVEETVAATNKNEDSVAKVKKSKRRRKQGTHIATHKTQPTIDISEKATDDSSNESKVIPDINKNKKRKRPIKNNKISVISKDFQGSVSSNERTITDNRTSENKKGNKSISENDQDSTEADVSTENLAQLKNIELPVDYIELLKDLTENRITRNSKSSKIIKSDRPAQYMAPVPDDIFKNFYPYLYFGNYFNQNSNSPFNFEQFYNPGRNNRKNKKSKNKSNEPKRDPQPKVIEVTLKPKRKESTTTPSPVTEMSTEEPIQYFEEITTQSDTTATDVPMQVPYEFFPTQTSEEEELQSEEVKMPENESVEMSQTKPVKMSKTEPIHTKANLEMPPTVIEDLNEFIEPDLDKEDIVPTIHTNGIIHDYYPTFYDDESHHLKDIEDDRHFYTTDRGHEELLNRDRRKYDGNNERKIANLDVKDRINFRRGFLYKERDKIKDVNQNLSIEQHTHEKLIQESVPTKSNDEVQFKSPPLLENPDFRTIMINKETPNTNLHPKFSRLIMDADLSKEIEPKNDRIETVFAKTRVVKYGVTKDEAEDNVSVSMPTYEDDGEMKHYSDGHTTYVMAKSVGHVDDYFW